MRNRPAVTARATSSASSALTTYVIEAPFPMLRRLGLGQRTTEYLNAVSSRKRTLLLSGDRSRRNICDLRWADDPADAFSIGVVGEYCIQPSNSSERPPHPAWSQEIRTLNAL